MDKHTNMPIFRVLNEHYEMIRKASEIVMKKGEANSFTDFLRRLIIRGSAEILGQPVPDLNVYHWGRKKKPITEVAERMGIPVKDLQKAWLEEMAEQALKKFLDDDEDAPKRKSDIGGLTPPPSEPRAVAPIRRRR